MEFANMSRRRFIVATGALAGTALLAACGEDTDVSDDDAPIDTGPAETDDEDIDSDEPSESDDSDDTDAETGGTVTFPLIANPSTLNPIMVSSTAEVQAAAIIHSSLVRLDPDTFEPEADVAESWSVSEDGQTWSFEIRNDVVFHDGTACSAEDVKFTMDRMVDPDVGSARGAQFASVESTEVVDESTVAFNLASAWAAMPTIIAGRFAVAPMHLLEDVDIATDTDYDRDPIGVGPYKVVEWASGDYIRLEANSDFFMGAPNIDQVVFRIIPDSNVQIAQLRTGEIDAIPFFADASIPAVSDAEDIEVDQGWGSVWYAVHVNMNRTDLFGDRLVRQALSYAIDRDALIANVVHGVGQVATGPIIPSIEWAYNPDVKTYPYDPDQAVELLEEAGWSQTDDGGWELDGVRLEFMISAFSGNASVEQACTLVQQYWANIGVHCEIEVLEFSTFITEVRDNRGADGYYSFVSYMTPEPEPDGNFAYFHSSHAERGSNFTAYVNEEIDELFEIGRQSTDQEERREAYFRIQEILAEDMTRMFLFYPPTNLVRRSRLQGLPPVNSYGHIEKAYLA